MKLDLHHKNDNPINIWTNVRKWSSSLLLLLLIASQYPYLLLYPFPGAPLARRFFILGPAVISAIAIFLILISDWNDIFDFPPSRSTMIFRLALITLFLICVAQFFIIRNYTFRELSFNLVWFTLPLAIFANGERFKRIFLPCMALFWCLNALYAAQDLWWWGEQLGLPANRNWHAALIVASTPFLLLWIRRFFPRKGGCNAAVVLLSAPPMIFSLIVLWRCQSRGVNLALLLSSIIVATAYLRTSCPLTRKTLRHLLFFGISIAFVASAIAILFFGDFIAHTIMRDVRIPLWGGAFSLFSQNPLLGVGAASYESHYAYHIPLAKFLRSWYYTERSDNPHSHFLYMLGSLGVVGFTAALYLWIKPIIHCLRNFHRLDFQTKLILFVFLALTIHSMVDIIMSVWPTMYIALILQGILWRECFSMTRGDLPVVAPKRRIFPFRVLARVDNSIIVLTTLAVLAFAGFMVFKDSAGSSAERKAVWCYQNGYFPVASQEYNVAAKANCGSIYSYQAGMFSLLYLGDYRLALKYFMRLQSLPDRIIAHHNAHIANCLSRMKRKTEALACMREELRVYPVSIIALCNTLRLERELGLSAQSSETAARLMEALKFKGLRVNDIKTILENPKLDGRYYLLRKNAKERTAKGEE